MAVAPVAELQAQADRIPGGRVTELPRLPALWRGLGGRRAHPPRGQSRPAGRSGQVRPLSPAPRPRTPSPLPPAPGHGRRTWRRARAPQMATDPEPGSCGSDPRARSWGEASSDIAAPAPAISFYYPSPFQTCTPRSALTRAPSPLLVPPAPLTLQSLAEFPCSPRVHVSWAGSRV